MKTDISSRSDIEKILNLFYSQIKQDDILSTFFLEILTVNWDKHVGLMGDFWENVLFYKGNYQGDPLTAHKRIHTLKPTEPEHFKRWLSLFSNAIDTLYKGKNAEKMKNHALGIAAIMQEKVGNISN